MEKLHPKAIRLFFFSRFLIGIIILTLIFLYFFIITFATPNVWVLVFGYLIMIILYLIFSYAWARLSYRYWKYEFAERGVRIERGILFKAYVTIPYKRIQNVDIYRGIMDRFLGLSTLKVQTAGDGGGGSEGILPGLGIETAEEIREKLTK